MQHLLVIRLRLILLPGDLQSITLLDQLNLFWGKPRNGHADPILVLTLLIDVVGRPVRAKTAVDQIEQPVEANSGAKQGEKIVRSHHHILLKATWFLIAVVAVTRSTLRARRTAR